MKTKKKKKKVQRLEKTETLHLHVLILNVSFRVNYSGAQQHRKYMYIILTALFYKFKVYVALSTLTSV